MGLETATWIDSLIVSNPDGSDQRSTADDHLRLIKACLKRSFPMIGGAVSASAQAISYVNDLSASVQAQLNVLRQGSATANNAINAKFANSASLALYIGTIPAAQVPALNANNVFTAFQIISAAVPGLRLIETGATANNKNWRFYATAEELAFNTEDDASAFGAYWLRVNRTGTVVDAIALNATLITVNGADVTNPVQLNSIAANSWARRDAAQLFEGGAGSQMIVLTDAATIAINANDGNVFRVVLGGNRTMAAPNNARSGQTIVFHILQDGTGSRTLTWNSIYKFAGSSAPTLSTAASAVDVFAFNYDSTSLVWRQAGLNVG